MKENLKLYEYPTFNAYYYRNSQKNTTLIRYGKKPVGFSGMATFYYDDDRIKSHGLLKDGEHHGIWTLFYVNGQKEKEGECIGSRIFTEKIGDDWEHKYGPICLGKWTHWNENGLITKEYLYDKEPLPIITYYNQKGIKYAKGRMKYIRYWSDYPSQSMDTRETECGEWKYWYENGKLKKICTYRKGLIDTGNMRRTFLLHDSYIEWYSNGQKRCEMRYKWGVKVGREIHWNEDGSIKSNQNHGVSLIGGFFFKR